MNHLRAVAFRLQSPRAEKDLLDDVRAAGPAGGLHPALLVGRRRDIPNPFRIVVGGLPQRLVLARSPSR